MSDRVYKTTSTMVVCPKCKGRGVTEKRVYNFFSAPPTYETCSACDGDRVLEEVVILRRANIKKEGV